MIGKNSGEDLIKITAKPFLIIVLLLIILVSLGSLVNYIRMKNRFAYLVYHSQVIYDAHKTEIEDLFKIEENLPKIKSVLEIINIPEKDIYQVDIIRKIEDTWVIYDSQTQSSNDNYNINKMTVSQKDIDLVQNYVEIKDSKKFGYQSNLQDFYNSFYKYYPYYDKDFLISILPINQNGVTVGYFVVATSKVQSN